MVERKTVGQIVKELLERSGISMRTACDWIGVGNATVSQKISKNTFTAEEVRTILDNLGLECKIVEGSCPINKVYGGIGPAVRMMVNRIIYDTAKSIALCHSDWNDGWRTELFKDEEGRFFVAHYTTWSEARNFISEIGKKDAMIYYAKYGNGENADLFD